MTVYAVQVPHTLDRAAGVWRPKLDASKAEAFGELVQLIPHQRVHAAMVTQPTLAMLRRALKDYSDEDYILPVGDICLVAMAVSVALNMNNGRVRLLRWSRDRRAYDVINLNIYGEK